MVARIPYTRVPHGSSGYGLVVTLGVQFSLKSRFSPKTDRLECILDSGAESCLFHADIALLLGLDLKSGVRELTRGIGSVEETWLHKVAVHAPGGPIIMVAGFKESLPCPGLLGMRGFFEHYTVTFDSALQVCTLDRIYKA